MPRDVFWFNAPFNAFTWSNSHVHNTWGELAYVGRGCMVMCSARGHYMVRPDTAVWVPPGMEHAWYIPCDSWDCSFFIRPQVFADLGKFMDCTVLHVTSLVRELILHLCIRPYPYNDDQTRNIVTVLLDLVNTLAVETKPLPMPRDPRLIELCAANISLPGTAYSMAEWGRLLGMSERNLSRLFSSELGISFLDWRQIIRLEHALNKLRQGESVT